MAKQISSYGIEIKHVNKIFYPTITLFRKAIAFCIEAFEAEWGDIEALSAIMRKGFAEKLIHTTKDNMAKYPDFDKLFYKAACRKKL